MSIYPGSKNFKMKSGGTWATTFQWKAGGVAVDITNYAARMQMREAADSVDFIQFTYTPVDPLNGIFKMSLTSDETNAILPGAYLYDLFLYRTDQGSNPETIPLCEGKIVVKENVTEPVHA